MALTITFDMPRPQRMTKDFSMLSGSIAFDTSYPTGGEAATLITKYFTTVKRLILDAGGTGYVVSYDAANDKIMAWYADYDAVADGILIQIPDTTDISAITAANFLAIGFRR